MSGSAAYLPFDELVEVLGDIDAVRLVAAVGGQRIYVPGAVPEHHPLAEAIGRPAAERLSAHIRTSRGGLWVELPLGPTHHLARQRARLEELAARGDLSEREVARLMHIHARTVRRARRRLRRDGDGAQGRLF